jgi:dihydrofolate reductase
VVISRNENWKPFGPGAEKVLVFSELKNAIEYCRGNLPSEQNIFIIGGAQVYELAFEWIDELWLTEIDLEADGDVSFPRYRDGKLQDQGFQLNHSEKQGDLGSPYRYRFNRYFRKI